MSKQSREAKDFVVGGSNPSASVVCSFRHGYCHLKVRTSTLLLLLLSDEPSLFTCRKKSNFFARKLLRTR
jgi:hypothetical protein